MTIKEAIAAGSKRIEPVNPETPILDSMLLLANVLSVPKERLLASYNEDLAERDLIRFTELFEKRSSGIPIAYLVGVKEFYGLPFHVDERVLIPRPDTEVLIETVLGIIDTISGNPRIHDACTGSGCIPVTLKHERPQAEISASDISQDALDVFLYNAKAVLGYALPDYRSDLLDSVPGAFDIITANPPYIRKDTVDSMFEAGWFEPRLALDGGPDGLSAIRRLIRGAMDSLSKAGYLILEIAYDQADPVMSLMHRAGLTSVTCTKDLGGHDRVVTGRKGT